LLQSNICAILLHPTGNNSKVLNMNKVPKFILSSFPEVYMENWAHMVRARGIQNIHFVMYAPDKIKSALESILG
jgi:hypothetical protein